MCSVNPVVSTSRDLILAYDNRVHTKKYRALLPMIKSFRSVNTRASFNLFYPQSAQLCGEMKEVARHYDVTLVPVPSSNQLPEVHRFAVYHDWLQQHAGEYDHVFHADSDVFFQGDIFGLAGDDMTIALEGSSIAEDIFNRQWMLVNGWDSPAIMNSTIICSGTFGGDLYSVMRMSKVLSNIAHMTKSVTHGIDQALMNYLVWSNRSPTPIKYRDCLSPLFTCGICCNTTGLCEGPDEFGNAVHSAVIIHQFNRPYYVVNHVKEKCGSTLKWLFDFSPDD